MSGLLYTPLGFKSYHPNINLDNVKFYTDASSYQGTGGWAWIAVCSGREMENRSGFLPKATNNYAELFAMLQALSRCKGFTANVSIVADSRYAIGVVTGEYRMPPHDHENYPIVKQCQSLLRPNITFQWIKGHMRKYAQRQPGGGPRAKNPEFTADHKWNHHVDKLAGRAREAGKQKRPLLLKPRAYGLPEPS